MTHSILEFILLQGTKKDPIRDSLTDTGYLFYLIWARMCDIDTELYKSKYDIICLF